MIVSVTELANQSESILDRVEKDGETVEVQRHGRTVAQITPAVGVSRDELCRILSQAGWTREESDELRKAMEEACEVVGYAGCN
jgi:prevent-host-death family protein